MRHWRTGLPFTLAVLVLGAGVLSGCGPEYRVELRYDRPAQYEIPAHVRKLGIAEFGGQDADDREWGNIAADRLASQLDAYNKQFHRYQLVDRKRLAAILDEQDLQAAIVDSSKAVEAGKIAHVDAMIYGTVSVTTKDEVVTRSEFDVFRRRMKEVRRTQRYVMAAVNFTIDDVETSRTLATVSTMREYDSSKGGDEGGGAKMAELVGFGGDEPPPADQVLSQLIDQCVAEFVAKISPHQIAVSEKLDKGKSDAVKTGNKLAVEGDYAGALEAYQMGIQAKPDDHQAVFNAGVMYEAMGKLDEAEEYYDRAFKMKPETQYVRARQRVRMETSE